MGLHNQCLPVEVVQEFIGGSDHKLVWAAVPCALVAQLSEGFGRVLWTDSVAWEYGLEEVSPLTALLAESTEQLLEAQHLRPQWFGGEATKKQRRLFLDCAAWARDTLYVLVGHAASALKVQIPRATSKHNPLLQAPREAHSDFKDAVALASWREKRRAVDVYLSLYETCPGKAEKFLSKLFKID